MLYNDYSFQEISFLVSRAWLTLITQMHLFKLTEGIKLNGSEAMTCRSQKYVDFFFFLEPVSDLTDSSVNPLTSVCQLYGLHLVCVRARLCVCVQLTVG